MTAAKLFEITLGVQAGDSISGNTVEPYFMSLRRLLREKCNHVYGSVIKEFAFVLRIDGSIYHWEKYGCDYLRLQKKSGYVTVDVFMPLEVWHGAEDEKLKEFFITQFSEGFRLMLERTLKAGLIINDKKLTADFNSAIEEFQSLKITKPSIASVT
jgi:hypothetical protein